MPSPFPLTLPAPGEAALTAWRLRYLRRTARLLFEGPHAVPPWLERAWSGVRASLGPVLAAHPGEVYAALALPQVGAPVHAGALAEAVPTLLLELARRRVLGREGVWWSAPVDRLLSPTLGVRLDFPATLAGMVFRDGEVEVTPGDVWALDQPRGEVAYHRLAEGGWLGLVDNNPLAMVEAHPEKAGNPLSLGEASAGQWVATIDEARALTRAVLPGLAAEHRALLATVVPVGGPMERSLSASYREGVGLVYVSLHPQLLTMAEALIHEVQHNKLNLVSHTDPLLMDGGRTLHTSPVRPDARPLWGVLLAVHAFLPVAELYARLAASGHPLCRASGFAARWEAIRTVNRDGMDTLRAHAVTTEAGRALLDGMDKLEKLQREGRVVEV